MCGFIIVILAPSSIVQKIRARHCCFSIRILVTAGTMTNTGIASLCHCGQLLCRQFWPDRFKVVESGCEHIAVDIIRGTARAMTTLPERECRRTYLALSVPSKTSFRIMGYWLSGAFATFIGRGVVWSVTQWVCVI